MQGAVVVIIKAIADDKGIVDDKGIAYDKSIADEPAGKSALRFYGINFLRPCVLTDLVPRLLPQDVFCLLQGRVFLFCTLAPGAFIRFKARCRLCVARQCRSYLLNLSSKKL